MSTPKCEMCGRDIPNAKNRQKFCSDCSKKRQAEQSHKSYLKHREHYCSAVWLRQNAGSRKR